MAKNQTTTPLAARDVEKAVAAWVATVRADGLSAVRTDGDRYATLWAEVEAHLGSEEEAETALVEAEVRHLSATEALEVARAEEKEARKVLEGKVAYRQARAAARRTAGLALLEMGVTGRQTGRILGVTEGAIRKWKKWQAAQDAPEVPEVDGSAPEVPEVPETTAPTPAEVRRALDAAADLLAGLDPVTSVKVIKSLESRVSKVTAALADLQARSAQGARNVA